MVQAASEGALGGGFRLMTSYKNELYAMNDCQYNVEVGFTRL